MAKVELTAACLSLEPVRKCGHHATVLQRLRLRVLAAVDRRMPGAELAKTFGVSASTIKRYLRLRRQTGDVQPKPIPGPPARKRVLLEEKLPTQVRLNPDLTLDEHCELFEETHGVEVSTATMSRALKRLGLPLKKDPRFLRERDEQEKAAFQERVCGVDPDLLKWVDEFKARIRP